MFGSVANSRTLYYLRRSRTMTDRSTAMTDRPTAITPRNSDDAKGGAKDFESPESMAEDAVARAIAERELRIASQIESPSKKESNDEQTSGALDKVLEHDKLLKEAWKPAAEHLEKERDDDSTKDEWDNQQPLDTNQALKTTISLLYQQIDGLIQDGLQAFHGLESTTRLLDNSTEMAESSGRELKRLKASEEQSRIAISNLFKAVEMAKSDTRDMSRVAQVEARLRRSMASLRSERDEALAATAESSRKTFLLEEEVRLVKAKLGRVAQEKIKMERDSRAAISLAKSLDSHASSDTEFYKRKLAELNDHLQAQQALVMEQKRQIEQYQRQMERNMSNNRLAHIRAGVQDKSSRKRGF